MCTRIIHSSIQGVLTLQLKSHRLTAFAGFLRADLLGAILRRLLEKHALRIFLIPLSENARERNFTVQNCYKTNVTYKCERALINHS